MIDIDIQNKNTKFALIFLIATPITIALLLEHIGGYSACELCYQQRWAYYGALVLLAPMWRGYFNNIILIILAVFFVANTILGLYHTGIEAQWWSGFSACSADFSSPGKISSLHTLLMNSNVVRCDSATLDIFGFTLANLNTLASFFISFFCLFIFAKSRKPRQNQ